MIAKSVRFLILRGGAIGDFIVTLPAIAALRERWPSAYIELIGYPHVALLAREGKLVDHVDSLDKAGIARFFSHNPAFPDEQVAHIRSFDLVLSYLHDPEGMVRNNLLLAGAKQVLYGSPIVNGTDHAVDHLIQPLESLAIYARGRHPQLSVPSDPRWGQVLAEWGQRTALIHPGSGSPSKNWPIDRFIELARRLRERGQVQPVFLFGEADREIEQKIARDLPDYPRFHSLSLLEVAGLMRACGLYVGNDSGISHLAAALGLPVVALFGPSSAVRWAPRGEKVTLLQAPDGAIASLSLDQVWEAVIAAA